MILPVTLPLVLSLGAANMRNKLIWKADIDISRIKYYLLRLEIFQLLETILQVRTTFVYPPPCPVQHAIKIHPIEIAHPECDNAVYSADCNGVSRFPYNPYTMLSITAKERGQRINVIVYNYRGDVLIHLSTRNPIN